MSRLARGLTTTFSALQVRNFRLSFAGQIVSGTGTWMQMIAQSWLVLDLTGNATVLGLVTALQWLPTLLLGPWAGVLADRVDKRRLLLCTQLASGLLAVVLGVLVATDVVQIWMVFGLAGTLGVASALDMPARQSFVLEMVGTERLANAISLNTTVLNSGRLIGPALAGLVISTWDLSVCFFANGLSFGASMTALALMRASELHDVPRAPRAKGQLREGLRHVWRTPSLRVPLLLMLGIGLFTYEFSVTLPVLARVTFGSDAAGYGLLQTTMSVGAIVGGLLVATRTAPTPGRLAVASGFFGATLVLLAVMPGLGAAVAVMPVVGLGSVLFLSLANSSLQLAAAPEMRSRVMALYGVAWVGSKPIGGPIVGWVAEGWGARWALVLGGLTAILGAGAAWRALRRTPPTGDVGATTEGRSGAERDEAQAPGPDTESGPTGSLRPQVA